MLKKEEDKFLKNHANVPAGASVEGREGGREGLISKLDHTYLEFSVHGGTLAKGKGPYRKSTHVLAFN